MVDRGRLALCFSSSTSIFTHWFSTPHISETWLVSVSMMKSGEQRGQSVRWGGICKWSKCAASVGEESCSTNFLYCHVWHAGSTSAGACDVYLTSRQAAPGTGGSAQRLIIEDLLKLARRQEAVQVRKVQ